MPVNSWITSPAVVSKTAGLFPDLLVNTDYQQAERLIIRRNLLLYRFDFIGSVLAVAHFGFQVVHFFEIRFQVLQHVKGFTASGTGGTDEHNGFVYRQRIYFALKLIHGNIDRGLEMTGAILIRIPHIDQIDALWIF